MYLVTDADVNSPDTNPSRWVATAIINELETQACEYREAAAQHPGRPNQHNRQARCVLEEAADTCDEIIDLISANYLSAQAPP